MIPISMIYTGIPSNQLMTSFIPKTLYLLSANHISPIQIYQNSTIQCNNEEIPVSHVIILDQMNL